MVPLMVSMNAVSSAGVIRADRSVNPTRSTKPTANLYRSRLSSTVAGNDLLSLSVAPTRPSSALFLASGDGTFAPGPIAAGFILPRLIGNRGATTTLPRTSLVFAAGLIVLILLLFTLGAGCAPGPSRSVRSR